MSDPQAGADTSNITAHRGSGAPGVGLFDPLAPLFVQADTFLLSASNRIQSVQSGLYLMVTANFITMAKCEADVPSTLLFKEPGRNLCHR